MKFSGEIAEIKSAVSPLFFINGSSKAFEIIHATIAREWFK